MSKKESKITTILRYIDKTPKCTHQQLVNFICTLNNKKYQSGYYHNNLNNLFMRKIIRVDKYKYYHLTKKGLKNISKPYALSTKEKLANKLENVKMQSFRKGYNHAYTQSKKNINNVSIKECREAINYLFTMGYTMEMTSDKRYYTEILLKKVANDLNMKLNFQSEVE